MHRLKHIHIIVFSNIKFLEENVRLGLEPADRYSYLLHLLVFTFVVYP